MRWVFFLLLLANAIAGYWFYGEAQQRTSNARQSEQALASNDQVPKLVLLKEAPEVTVDAKFDVNVEDKPELIIDGGAVAKEQVSLLIEGEAESENTIAEAVDIEQAIVDQISEEEVRQKIVAEPERCLIIGPFVDNDVVVDIGVRLDALNMKAEVIQREVIIREDYWLIIPPLESEQAALSLLKELQAEKIDSFIIPDGEFLYGITLGVFSSSENVENYRSQLLEMGYQPIIHLLPRTSLRYWLGLQAVDAKQLSEEFWSDIRQLSRSSNVSVEMTECGQSF